MSDQGEVQGMLTTFGKGRQDASMANDPPIVQFRSKTHPELTVWHPNGASTVQFHNNRLGTAHPEWIAILRSTPEVEEVTP